GFNFHRITSKVPGSLVSILLATVAVALFELPVDTIGSVYGDIPLGIPKPSIPSIGFDTIKQLIEPAVAIALLGGIESLLSALVADGSIGGRNRPSAQPLAHGHA